MSAGFVVAATTGPENAPIHFDREMKKLVKSARAAVSSAKRRAILRGIAQCWVDVELVPATTTNPEAAARAHSVKAANNVQIIADA